MYNNVCVCVSVAYCSSVLLDKTSGVLVFLRDSLDEVHTSLPAVTVYSGTCDKGHSEIGTAFLQSSNSLLLPIHFNYFYLGT